MKTRLSLFFLFFLFSINSYGLTSACYHDGGYSPNLRNLGSYSPSDYYLAPHHAIRSELNSPFSDDDWDILVMNSSGGTRIVTLPIAGQYGYWDFDGASMVGLYESPLFYYVSGYPECDHSFSNVEVSTTFSISPAHTVKAGDAITISWNGTNATFCQDAGTGGTWSASGSLPLFATEDLTGTHSMTCYYRDAFGDLVHIHHSDQSTPINLVVNPSCYVSSQDDQAVSTLGYWSANIPYEQGVVFYCVSDELEERHHQTSFSGCTDHYLCSASNDPCELNFLWSTPGSVSAAHRHPYFTSSSQYIAGDGCHDDTNPPSIAALNSLNSLNNDFGTGGPEDDFDFSNNRGPLYLLTPTGSSIKVLESGTPRVVQ